MSDYVYANLLGQWVKLGGSDEIDGQNVDDWASKHLKGNQIPEKYLNVRNNGNYYAIHPAQITLARE